MFDWRKPGGPFLAPPSVHTAVSAPALLEFMKELRGMAGQQPLTPKELEFAKAYVTRGYPSQFETPSDIATKLTNVVKVNLPDDYFNTVVPSVQAMTVERGAGGA